MPKLYEDRDEHEAWVYRPFVRTISGAIAYHPDLPADSNARKYGFRPLRALIRPWAPAGLSPGGIWLDRHDRHPFVWCFILAAIASDLTLFGWDFDALYHYKRFSDEEIDEDTSQTPTYIGEKCPIRMVRLDQMTFAAAPAPLKLPI